MTWYGRCQSDRSPLSRPRTLYRSNKLSIIARNPPARLPACLPARLPAWLAARPVPGAGSATYDLAVAVTPAAAQLLRDLPRRRPVRERIDREYAQPLDVEALAP